MEILRVKIKFGEEYFAVVRERNKNLWSGPRAWKSSGNCWSTMCTQKSRLYLL